MASDTDFNVIIDEMMNDRKSQMRGNLLSASDTNPDQYAQATQLGRKMQTPPQYIATDMERYTKYDRVKPSTVDSIIDNYPAFAEWVNKPDNARVVHDDLDAMDYAAGTVKALGSVIIKTGDAVRSGYAGAITGVAGLTSLGGTMQDIAALKRQYEIVPSTESAMLDFIGGNLMTVTRGLESVAETVRPPEERRNFTDTIGEGIGQVGSQIAAAMINPALAYAMMFGQGSYGQQQRLDEKQITDAWTRLQAQGLSGAATVATERISLGYITRHIPGLDRLFGKLPGKLQKSMENKLVDIGSAGGVEAAQEAFQSFVDDAISYFTFNPDQEFFTTIREEAAAGGAVGATARAILLGMAGGRRAGTTNHQVAQAENVKAALNESVAAAEQLKLRARDPQLYREALTVMTEGEEGTFDAGLVDELYQSEADVDRFFEEVPEARAAFDEAELTGSDVKLPLDKVIAFMSDNPEYEYISDFIKVEGGISARQASDANFFNDQVQEILEQARSEQATFEQETKAQTFADQIEDQITRNLTDIAVMGNKVRTLEIAQREAGLHAAFVRSMYERGGDQVLPVLQNIYGQLQIKGPQAQPPRLPITGQDLYIDELRKQVAQRRKSQEKKSTVKDLLGNAVNRSREKATPKPLQNILIERGGVKRGSPAAKELEAAGVTPKAYPRLFKRNGAISELDNIVLDELEESLGTSGVFTRAEDFNGYVDRNEIVEALRDETFGNYIRTDEQVQADVQAQYDDDVLAALDAQGVDIETATNDEIKAALDRAQAEYNGQQNSNEYYQDELDKILADLGDIEYTDQQQIEVDNFLRENEQRRIAEEQAEVERLEAIKARANRLKRFRDSFGVRTDTAAWTDKRLDDVLSEYSHRNGVETKAQIAFVDPLDFVLSTAGLDRAQIISENAGELNKDKIAKEGQTPFLIIENGEIIGHEGRHRMIAMAKAGVGRAPVLIRDFGRGYDTSTEYIESMPLKRQDYLEGGKSETDIVVQDVYPLMFNRKSAIKDALQQDQASVLFQSAPPTDSKAFKDWFGDSKVVDENGEPLVVYHGTNTQFEEFSIAALGGSTKSNSAFEGFFFVDNTDVAQGYGELANERQVTDLIEKSQAAERVNDYDLAEQLMEEAAQLEQNLDPTQNVQIIETYLSLQNPIEIDADGQGFMDLEESMTETMRRAKENGHDGIIIRNFRDNAGYGQDTVADHYVVFNPTQIKSVNNRGTFDASDPRILYQDDNIKRGSIQFGDQGERVINLFEKADFTTFLHESGHLFLDIYSQMASDPDATNQIKDDFQKTLKWLGVESVDQIGVEQHEKFARGFEAYLYEGNAPSKGLRRMFENFKLWMINAYRNIQNLDVKLSDEMRGVFDRMLATDEEIQALAGDPLVKPNEQTLEMLTKAQREKYQQQQQEAFDRAKNMLLRKALRQKRREAKQWWIDERASAISEAEAQIQSDPVYQVIQAVTQGTDFDGNLIFEGEYKLNEKDVADLYGSKEIVKYLPRGSRTKDAGVDIRILADMYGFTSPKVMIDAMVNATPYKQRVQAEADFIMAQRHGDLLNDGTIEREAYEMVMSEMIDHNMIELQVVSEKTGAAYPSDGDFKEAARRAIAEQKVDHSIKPDKYYRAALKAEREYGKALANQDFEAAADAKRKVILNKNMFREARDAREEVNKALKLFNQLNKTPPKKQQPKIDPEYHQKIWELLGNYDLGPRMTQARELKLQLQAINQWIEAKQQDEQAALLMPPELLAAQEKQHYRDLSMSEFRALRDMVKNIETQGRRKLEYIAGEEKRALNELADELIATAAAYNEEIDRPRSQRNEKKLGAIIGNIDAINTKAQVILSELDGGDTFGIWTRTIFEPLQQAEVQKVIRTRTESETMKAIMDKNYGQTAKRYRLGDRGRERLDPANYIITYWDEKFEVRGGEHAETLTREEIITIAMHQGTEDNQIKLLEGYEDQGWNQEFIDNALSNMSAADWNYVQDVWDYMDTFWPEVKSIEQKRFGYAPEKIEAKPLTVETADGQTIELRGGYMRIKYDPRFDSQAEKDLQTEAFMATASGTNVRPQTRNGSTHERVNNVRKPIRLDQNVVSEHINEQIAYITMSEAVENAAKVLRKQNVRQSIKDRLGDQKLAMLELWLQDVAAEGAMTSDLTSRTLRALRKNYTIGRLGLRPMTALLQFSGMIQAAGDVGTGNMLRGLTKTFSRGNPWAISKEVKEKSAFMKEREFTLTRDIADAMKQLTRPGASQMEKAASYMMLPMQKMQEVVDTVTWNANYQQAIRDGLDDADAVRKADIAVARTQGSGLVSDLAAIERGTLGHNAQRQETVKLLTMFFSYFNAKYNVVKTKNIQWKNSEITGFEMASSVMMTFLLEGLVSALIMGQLDLDRDDDGSVGAAEIATTVGLLGVSQAAASVPFLRDVSGAVEGFTPQGAAQAQAGNLGNSIGRFAKDIYDVTQGESVNGYATARAAINAANVALPIPAGMMNQFLRGMEQEEKSGDAGIMDYLVYRKN